MPVEDDLPDLRGGFGEAEQLLVLGIDRPLCDEKVEVDEPAPVCLADKNDRNRRYLSRLRQRQRLEQLVERAKSVVRIIGTARAFR